MNYQQAFADHYKAVRARIVNPKLKMPPAEPICTPLEEPQREPEPKTYPRITDPRVDILLNCASEYDCTFADIMGPSRRTNVSLARRKAIWLIYARGRMSKSSVGRYFNKDHTTVIHALRSYKKDLAILGEVK